MEDLSPLDLAENAERLRRAEEEKDALVSFASHELRTPLTSVLGYALMLERRMAANPDAYDEVTREAIETITGESRRMAEIIDYFVDLGRAESGRMATEIENVDLVELVDEEIERARTKAPGAVIESHLPEGELILQFDGKRLRQVVSNLLDNALKYSGTPARINVSSTIEDGSILLRVRDCGPGVSEADRPRIFERFYRGEAAATGRNGGLGIGLYLSRQLMQQLAGDLELTSVPGEGAEFTVTCPLTASRQFPNFS
jgi:signal transduction histidine kinase